MRGLGIACAVVAIAWGFTCSAATILDESGNGHTGTTGSGFTGATSPTLNGSYGTFTKGTDTIQLSGDVSLSTQETYEATVRFSSLSYSTSVPKEGGIWDAWQAFNQDNRLSILDGGSALGFTYNLRTPTNAQQTAALSGGSLQTNHWYNLAYVYDGSQERVYVDGTLVASRSSSGTIPTGPSAIMSIGGMFRDGALVPSFLGDLASLRVSNVARYVGNSYAPSTTGYFTPDGSTQMLINLPEPSIAGALGLGMLAFGRRTRRPAR